MQNFSQAKNIVVKLFISAIIITEIEYIFIFIYCKAISCSQRSS